MTVEQVLAEVRVQIQVLDAALRDVEREQRRQNELIAELIKRQGVNTAIRDVTPEDIINP